MNAIDRRNFLKITGAGACAAAASALPQSVSAQQTSAENFDDKIAKLYDATRCIGCRSCLRACREANGLPTDPGEIDGVAFDMPAELSEKNWMTIEAYRDGGTGKWSFIKRNCMQCNIPACVSVCPVAALVKTRDGPVIYHEDRCIGCRYCLMACPYSVPRYEWVNRVPRVRKCIFNLSCVKACPTGALISGKRRELIDEARRRIREYPGRYVDHVYGEHEGGGTSYLIVAGMSLEKYGMPRLPPTPRSGYAEKIMASLPGWIIGMGLFLGGLYKLQDKQPGVDDPARPAAKGA